MNNSEIILFKSPDDSVKIDVLVEEETVWLTQLQMVDLFQSTKQNISLHIGNVFKEKELEYDSTVKENLIVQIEGKRKVRRKTKLYNLDVIISVGYRVKSQRGTQFRIWANNILKNYLLRGYSISNRIEKIEKKLYKHDEMFELFISSNLLPKEGIFFNGEIFDAYAFVSQLIKSAKHKIVLIDNYIDESVFLLLTKRNEGVSAEVYTKTIDAQLKLDISRYNAQYEPIDVKKFSKSHDRFLIIDDDKVYHIGASLKDLGKKWFAFSKIDLNPKILLDKL